jgi:tellurite methyltransferase
MTTDYDTLYGTTANALGDPTPAVVRFFERLAQVPLRVLDIGCGQGRDALFIARLGHVVVGIVADITTFTPDSLFDVLLFDRILHLLPEAARLRVLDRHLDHVKDGGWVLILDEPSNMAGVQAVLSAHAANWTHAASTRSMLVARRS